MATIFILSNASGYGGSERSVELLANEIAKDSKLIVFAENKVHYSNLTKYHSEFKTVLLKNEKNIFSIFLNILIILKCIIFQTPDLIIANTNKAAFYLGFFNLFLISFYKKTKKVFFVRDFTWRHKKIIKTFLYDAKVCIPSEAVSYYASYFKTKQTIIPDPVQLLEKDNYSQKKSEEKVEIICVAMLSKWKGIDYLIKACNLIDSDRYNIKIIGDSRDTAYLNELQELVASLNLSEIIEFIPYTNDINSYFIKSDIIVSPSISDFGGPETFGRTIIEAWNFSKPVIAFNCGGPSYLIKNNFNGFLVEEKNIVELSKAMSLLINDKNLRLNLGDNGRKTVEQDYQVNIVAKKIYDLLN